MKPAAFRKSLSRVSRDLRSVIEKADADLEREDLARINADEDLPTENTMHSLISQAESALGALEDLLAWMEEAAQA